MLEVPNATKIQEEEEMAKIARERIERAARIYASNTDAGLALGIAPGSFGRLCRHYGIDTPKNRRIRSFEDQQRMWDRN